MNRLLAFLAALMFAAVIMPLSAQRRVTPVTPREPGSTPQITTNLKQQVDSSRLVTTIDAHGNTVMVDTVTGLEFVDSTLLKAPPKMEYPLLHEVIAGVNVWDPIMRALGQKYGLGDVWAELSMHNRYFPFFAVGLGTINETPVDKNFTFKSPVAPYFKIGGSYNFFYNSNPDYRLQMGLRYGFTTYKWSARRNCRRRLLGHPLDLFAQGHRQHGRISGSDVWHQGENRRQLLGRMDHRVSLHTARIQVGLWQSDVYPRLRQTQRCHKRQFLHYVHHPDKQKDSHRG